MPTLNEKTKIELCLKLIQYATAAVVMTAAFAGYASSQKIVEVSFFLIPIFCFTVALSAGVGSLMHAINQDDKSEDWFYKLIEKLHNNGLFRDWYWFLVGTLSLEIILFLVISHQYNLKLPF